MPFSLPPRLPRPARFPKPRFLALFLLFAAAFSTPAENIKDIRPTGYVTDLAHVINADTKAGLESLCLEVEQKTAAQMAIVTVRSLEGESVEQYTNELFQQLGVGNKKENRGVLLLVAPTERKYWIEVGYGLEPVITDARAGDAGRLMRSFFLQGNYSRGIEAAAWQLAKLIADDRGVTLSAAPPAKPAQPAGNGSPSIPFWAILIGIFIIIRIISALFGSSSGRGGRPGSGWWIGPVIGGMLGGGGFGGSSGGRSDGGGGFGGFGGGSSGGGGAGGSW